jgi:hypothetical protein
VTPGPRLASKGRAIGWQAATAALFLVGAVMNLLRRTDVDVAWLLTLGEKMLAGQRPYIDIFEANPPMSILMYLPAILAGRWVGLAADTMVPVLVMLGSVASLALSGRILAPLVRDPQSRWTLAAGGVFILTVLPTGVFTQREHIAVVAMLPFLAVVVARGEGQAPGAALASLAGLGCGLAMTIKPHFALVAGPPVLLSAWRLRSFRPILAIEIWAASLVVFAYAAALFLVFAAFLDFAPVIRDAYLPLRRPLSMLLFSPPLPVWLMVCVLTGWTRRGRSGGGWAAASLLAASLGGAASYLIQGKAWPYQAYPMLSLSLLALIAAAVLGERIGTGRKAIEPIRLARAAFALAAVAAAMNWFTYKGDYRQLDAPVAAVAPRPRLLAITADIALGHPLVRELHGQWVGSVCSQWISAGALTLEARGGLTADRRARLEALMRRDRGWLTADILRGRPDIILIDQQSYDWAAWARADPDLAAALNAYQPVRTVQGIAIWARKDRPRPAA